MIKWYLSKSGKLPFLLSYFKSGVCLLSHLQLFDLFLVYVTIDLVHTRDVESVGVTYIWPESESEPGKMSDLNSFM